MKKEDFESVSSFYGCIPKAFGRIFQVVNPFILNILGMLRLMNTSNDKCFLTLKKHHYANTVFNRKHVNPLKKENGIS